MKQIERITVTELSKLAERIYGDFIKGVVDLNKGLLVIDAKWHADIARELEHQGSRREDLWGINLHPAKFGSPEFIEFDSMINLRHQGNQTRSVEHPDLQLQIRQLVTSKVKP